MLHLLRKRTWRGRAVGQQAWSDTSLAVAIDGEGETAAWSSRGQCDEGRDQRQVQMVVWSVRGQCSEGRALCS